MPITTSSLGQPVPRPRDAWYHRCQRIRVKFSGYFPGGERPGFSALVPGFCADVGPLQGPGDAGILVFRTQVASQKAPGPGPLGPAIPAALICAHAELACSYKVTDKEGLGCTSMWWLLRGRDSVSENTRVGEYSPARGMLSAVAREGVRGWGRGWVSTTTEPEEGFLVVETTRACGAGLSVRTGGAEGPPQGHRPACGSPHLSPTADGGERRAVGGTRPPQSPGSGSHGSGRPGPLARLGLRLCKRHVSV